jgi:hypothetical protein
MFSFVVTLAGLLFRYCQTLLGTVKFFSFRIGTGNLKPVVVGFDQILRVIITQSFTSACPWVAQILRRIVIKRLCSRLESPEKLPHNTPEVATLNI